MAEAVNDKDLRLAVLIDADNASRTAMKDVMAEVAVYGTPTIKRIYGDWTSPNMSTWKSILLETAITPIQQYSYTTGKNATDSAMIIDAMDILYSGNCDGFVLVSSDSDFTRLAVRLREAGMKVYGMGEKKTPKPFIVACDKFVYIEVIRAAAKQAASIVALLPANNLAGPALFDFAAPSKALDLVKYSAADAIAALADEGSTVELYAGYGKNIVTALATINGSAVGILATEKAALCHKCTAKAARFVRLCDAYSIPVVTVVNTEGFGKSEGDDQAGGIRQAARMAGVYAEATTVKVAVLAGEAVGPAYTVFAACADWRVAVQGCTVAPLAPEAAVTVLYKDEIFASDNIVNATKAKAAAYAKEVCSANAAVANGAADAIADAATARGAVAQALDMLASKRTVRLAKKHGNITL